MSEKQLFKISPWNPGELSLQIWEGDKFVMTYAEAQAVGEALLIATRRGQGKEEPPMKTVTIQIGNSDDKLTQKEWSSFCHLTHEAIFNIAHKVHFRGFADGDAPWQNACWVIEVHPDYLRILFQEVGRVGRSFHQDAIAIAVGETRMA